MVTVVDTDSVKAESDVVGLVIARFEIEKVV